MSHVLARRVDKLTDLFDCCKVKAMVSLNVEQHQPPDEEEEQTVFSSKKQWRTITKQKAKTEKWSHNQTEKLGNIRRHGFINKFINSVLRPDATLGSQITIDSEENESVL